MRVHESSREEIGLILTLVGIGVLLFGIIDRIWMWDVSFLGGTIAWAFIIGGAAATLLGIWLHITRSRKREDITVPPRENTASQSAQGNQPSESESSSSNAA